MGSGQNFVFAVLMLSMHGQCIGLAIFTLSPHCQYIVVWIQGYGNILARD